METKLNKKLKGIILGIIVGITWGLDSVFMEKIGESKVFEKFDLAPLVSSFFHDSFCFLWIFLILVFSKKFLSIFSLIKTKKGLAIMIAGIVGSPLGMSAYQMAIKYATSPYAASISVVYPGVGAILSYFILKEKLTLKGVIGISISLLGAFMLGFSPSKNLPPQFLKGILFAFLSVLGWALEGVIIAIAMNHIKNEEHIKPTSLQILCLRFLISVIVYSFVVLPSIKAYPIVINVMYDKVLIDLAGVGLIGAINYLCWYKSVDLVGASIGTGLNSISALWTIIFSILIFDGQVTSSLIFWGIVTIFGLFIFIVGTIKNKDIA